MAPDKLYKKPKDAKLRTGAGGVVARLEGGRVRLALVRERRFPDYVLPKGGVEEGETLEEAAARETMEEAGFTQLQCLGKLGTGERLSTRRNTWQVTHYFLFLTGQIDVQPVEAGRWEVAWFDLDQLPSMYFREQLQLVKENVESIRRMAGK